MLGFYKAATHECMPPKVSLDAAFVTDELDAWAAIRTRPTVFMFDNAKIHHAATSQTRLYAW